MDEYPKIRLEWVPSAYRQVTKVRHKPEGKERSMASKLYGDSGMIRRDFQNKVKHPRYR